MYTQRNVPKYNTSLNKQFSLLTFMFKYIFTNLIVLKDHFTVTIKYNIIHN